MTEHSHPVWLEIDLSIVEQNVRAVRQISGADFMAVVKANAYGYGAVEVARAAVRGGATWLGVARVDEALALRRAGFCQPILVLGMIPTAQIDDCIAQAVHLPAGSFEIVEQYARRASALGTPLNVHLKVDTGMGRLGVLPEEALALARHIKQQPMLALEGLYSHLADADRMDDSYTELQIRRFESVRAALYALGIQPRWVHLANTAGALGYPAACYNLVRCGQALVGHNAFSDRPLHHALRRAMRAWKARLLDFREESGEFVGWVSAGFGDGFWHQPGSEVLVGGRRQALIGLPEIDCMRFRLDRRYPTGSEVVLVGTQGAETITIQDLARRWDTGPGKITAVIPAHVPRVYL